MIRSLTRLAVAFGLAATALTAAAHHSFAIFDHTQTVTLQGKVLSFQWTNPHGYLELDVHDGPKNVDHYTLELTSINMLQRRRLEVVRRERRRRGDRSHRAALERGPWRLAARAQGARRPHARAAGARDRHLQADAALAMGAILVAAGAAARHPSRRRSECARATVAALAALAAWSWSISALAQAPAAAPDFSGSWERYRGPPGDKNNPPPESDPPLRAQFAGEWTARRDAARAADARGEPIATGYVHCLPDGVPSMMSGPFPFEIVQGREQMNIAQEAYSQIRRIYLGKSQVTLRDIELGFYGHSVGNWEGNTLVVDTIGIKDYVRFRDVPHTRACESRSA